MAWVDAITSARVFRAIAVFMGLTCLAMALLKFYAVVAYPPDEFIFGVNDDLVYGVVLLVTGPYWVYAYWQWAAHEEEVTS